MEAACVIRVDGRIPRHPKPRLRGKVGCASHNVARSNNKEWLLGTWVVNKHAPHPPMSAD